MTRLGVLNSQRVAWAGGLVGWWGSAKKDETGPISTTAQRGVGGHAKVVKPPTPSLLEILCCQLSGAFAPNSSALRGLCLRGWWCVAKVGGGRLEWEPAEERAAPHANLEALLIMLAPATQCRLQRRKFRGVVVYPQLLQTGPKFRE